MAIPSTHSEITFFGKTNFRNQEVPFGIKTDDRRRHMYIIGKTGMGRLPSWSIWSFRISAMVMVFALSIHTAIQ
jgi:hypothetical protein